VEEESESATLHHESFNHLYIAVKMQATKDKSVRSSDASTGKLARFGGKETSLLHERKIFAGFSF
jgi:hypothetical protein